MPNIVGCVTCTAPVFRLNMVVRFTHLKRLPHPELAREEDPAAVRSTDALLPWPRSEA
jgi:hypothetical protein